MLMLKVLLLLVAFQPDSLVVNQNPLELARIQIINQEYEDAKITLESVTQQSRNKDYYLMVGQVTLALQQYEFAIEALQIARGFDPNDLNLMLQLARTYRIAGQSDLAESLAETIIARDTTHRQALILYGSIQTEKTNWSRARSVYQRLVDVDSTNTHFRYQLAQALNELDQKGVALIHLRAANSYSPKHHGVLHDLIAINAELNLNDIAREYAIKAIEMSPNFIPFRKRLAEIEFKEQNYAGAANQYLEVLNLGDRTQFTYRNYGMSLYFADQFTESIKAFEASLKLGDDPNVHFYKAMALIQTGDVTNAQLHLNQAVENSMGDLLIDSFIQLGSLLDKTGNIEESIKNYQIAQSLAPERIEIHFYMGSAYDRTGNNRSKARDHFRSFLNAEVQRDPTMENYARSRISKLNEEIHFRE